MNCPSNLNCYSAAYKIALDPGHPIIYLFFFLTIMCQQLMNLLKPEDTKSNSGNRNLEGVYTVFNYTFNSLD